MSDVCTVPKRKILSDGRHYLSLAVRKPTRSDTNRAAQPQKVTRGLNFRIKEEEGFYYL